jgi:hypothetical protein
MSLRCIVCDNDRIGTAADADEHRWCNTCKRKTLGRPIAGMHSAIAPGSAITYGQQQAIYHAERAGLEVRHRPKERAS